MQKRKYRQKQLEEDRQLNHQIKLVVCVDAVKEECKWLFWFQTSQEVTFVFGTKYQAVVIQKKNIQISFDYSVIFFKFENINLVSKKLIT